MNQLQLLLIVLLTIGLKQSVDKMLTLNKHLNKSIIGQTVKDDQGYNPESLSS